MMPAFLQVAIGGALGSVLRYGVTLAAGRMTGLPLGTLAVNVAGSFVMGFLAAVLVTRGNQHLAPFLMTGLLGGFTTFSAFSLDALNLWQRAGAGPAVGYVTGSVLLSLLAVVAGLAIGRVTLA